MPDHYRIEVELLQRVSAGNESALVELVERRLGYVKTIARNWAQRHGLVGVFDELEAEAQLELVHFVARFDPSRYDDPAGAFAYYLNRRIPDRLRFFAGRHLWFAVGIGADSTRAFQSIIAERDRLRERGTEPTVEELSRATGRPVGTVNRLLAKHGERTVDLNEVILHTSYSTPETVALRSEARRAQAEVVAKARRLLDDDCARTITRTYGLDGRRAWADQRERQIRWREMGLALLRRVLRVAAA